MKYIYSVFNLVYFKNFLTQDQVSHTQLCKTGNEQEGTRTVGFGGFCFVFLNQYLFFDPQNAKCRNSLSSSGYP